jgi:hypothetical protein
VPGARNGEQWQLPAGDNSWSYLQQMIVVHHWSCPGLRLAQPEGPTARVLSFLFHLKTEEDPASERNIIEI